MRNNPNITQEELVKIIGIKSTAIEDNIKFLKENEYIERKGSKKTGYWMGYFDQNLEELIFINAIILGSEGETLMKNNLNQMR